MSGDSAPETGIELRAPGRVRREGGTSTHPPSQAACDRLTALAARLLEASGALISVMDENRPFLISSCGIDGAEGVWGRTPLTVSLSQHAGTADEPFVIRDIGEHPYLRDDPAVEALGMVSFLGVPLVDGDRSVLGILGVVDRRPRDWSGEEIQDLTDLASSVVTEIHLRGSIEAIHRTERETARRTEAKTREELVELIEGLDAIVWEREVGSPSFTFVSRRAEDILGYPVDRWIEEPHFWQQVIVHPEDRDRVQKLRSKALADGRDHDLEYRACRADGETLWMRSVVRVIADEAGTPRLLRGVILDVTEQRRASEDLVRSTDSVRLLQEIAVAANEATSLEPPLQLAVGRICEFTGWPVGHLYLPSSDEPVQLVPTSIWHLDEPDAHADFRRATEETRFEPGEGLPGRVYASGQPAWIEDLGRDESFTRAPAARASGLRAGFAFPLLTGHDVVGVAEFYHPSALPANRELMELSGHAGTILGRVVERMRAESERRASETRLRRMVETAHDAFISMDDQGLVREWNPQSEKIFGWSRDEALGRAVSDLIIPDAYRREHMRGLSHFMQTGEGPVLNQRLELPARTRDGTEIPVEITISPMRIGGSWVFNAFLHDISDRKRAEEERRKREGQLAEAQRLARLGSWEWDIRNDRITWTDELYRIFGLERDDREMTFERYRELLPEEDRETAVGAIQGALEGDDTFAFEHRVVHPGGEVRHVHSQGRVYRDEAGEAVRMAGTAQDITERKELERRAQQLAIERAGRAEAEAARGQIRRILESITDAFFALDEDWRFTYVNRQAEDLLQRKRDELISASVWDAFPDAVGSNVEDRYREAVNSGLPVEFEEFYLPVEKWFEVRAYPSSEGLSVYFHDINERKKAEQRLRETEERFRFLADSVPQQIWTARPDGGLDYVNRVAEEYFGRPVEQITDEGWKALVHPDDLEQAVERWAASLETAVPYEVEFRLVGKDGEARWHLARARAQQDESGRIVRWFGTNTDIHDQKIVEAERDRAVSEMEKINYILESDRAHLQRQTQELRDLTRALEKTNADLDQFAYVASHDLKAPLRGIANLADWLEEDLRGTLDDQTREYMELLKGRVHRMESLIEGILEYSRAGREKQEKEWVDVAALVREVVDMVDPPERFEVDIDPKFPTILAPPAPLQQVFLNLIGNAVKHADTEAPEVRVRLSDEGVDWYEFSVEDNGPGIAEEFQDKIWTIFQTLKPRDVVEGTGIGLAVVKRIVEHQGGQVWVESEEGEGAAFRFLWPRREMEAREENEEDMTWHGMTE